MHFLDPNLHNALSLLRKDKLNPLVANKKSIIIIILGWNSKSRVLSYILVLCDTLMTMAAMSARMLITIVNIEGKLTQLLFLPDKGKRNSLLLLVKGISHSLSPSGRNRKGKNQT